MGFGAPSFDKEGRRRCCLRQQGWRIRNAHIVRAAGQQRGSRRIDDVGDGIVDQEWRTCGNNLCRPDDRREHEQKLHNGSGDHWNVPEPHRNDRYDRRYPGRMNRQQSDSDDEHGYIIARVRVGYDKRYEGDQYVVHQYNQVLGDAAKYARRWRNPGVQKKIMRVYESSGSLCIMVPDKNVHRTMLVARWCMNSAAGCLNRTAYRNPTEIANTAVFSVIHRGPKVEYRYRSRMSNCASRSQIIDTPAFMTVPLKWQYSARKYSIG